MTPPSIVIGSLLSELRRRNVTQIILGYGAFAWLLLQIGALLFETFEYPAWSMRVLFYLLLAGLPVTVIVAWVFDFSPRGLERTASLEQVTAHRSGLPVILRGHISRADSDSDITTQHANLLLRESALWAGDFNSTSTRVLERDLLVSFEDATDALLYAVRVQAHARQLGISLRIGIAACAGGEVLASIDGKAADSAGEFAMHAESGTIVVEKEIRSALIRVRDEQISRALQPVSSDKLDADRSLYGIDSSRVDDLDEQLKARRNVVQTSEPSTLVKVLALLFLTVTVGLIWTALPSLQQSGDDPVPTLAVLPFTDPSEDIEFALMVDGLSEDLFNAIARIEDIRISARRSSRALRGSDKSVQEIGELLNAMLLLEGEIKPIDGRLKVTAWLTETDTGLERWSRSYERPASSLDQIRLDLTTQLADELGLKIPAGALAVQSSISALHPSIYPRYLEALGYLNLPMTEDSLDEAERRFLEVIEIEPAFQAARAGLCRTYLARYINFKDVAQFETAQGYCQEALDEQQQNVDLLLALGELNRVGGDNEKAEEFFNRGLELNATNVGILKGIAAVYLATDRRTEAERSLRQAIDLDPAYVPLYTDLGTLYLGGGQWERAIDSFGEAVNLAPADYGALSNLGSAYFFAGRFAEAAEAYERSLEIEPNRTALSNTATMHFYSGDYSRAAELYLKSTELAPKDFRLWANLGDARSQIPGSEELAASHYLKALGMINENLEVNSEDPELLALASWCAANTGREEEAELRINEAVMKAGNNPIIFYSAAQVHARLGNRELAQRFVERALETGFPRNVMAATPNLGELVPSADPSA